MIQTEFMDVFVVVRRGPLPCRSLLSSAGPAALDFMRAVCESPKVVDRTATSP